VTGISYIVTSVRPGGRRYRFFYVRCGGQATPRKINIDTLGKDEAFHRAVKLRAIYETDLLAANAAILAARECSVLSFQCSARKASALKTEPLKTENFLQLKTEN
jgi:hypothetical protein